MRRFLKQGVLSLVGLLLSGAPASAFVLGTSARQMQAGDVSALLYYQGVKDQDLIFSVGGSGTCQGNNSTLPVQTFPCGSTGDIEAQGSGEAMMAKLVYQPYENLQYYAQAGAGKYKVDVGSFTIAGDNPGFLGGIGVKGVILPDTIVSPAVAVDAGLFFHRYMFDRIEGSLSGDSSRLDMFQARVALEVSHLFRKVDEKVDLEPYGGVKWVRTRAWLKDYTSGDRTGGRKDTVHPFIGLRVPVFEKEAFFAEAAFANGIYYAGGLNVRFGGNS